MDASEGSDILQLHHGVLLTHHHVTNLQGTQHALFQNATGTHYVMIAPVAFGYSQGNGFTCFLQVKRVVAHGQITNLQKSVTESAGLDVIAYHRSLTQFKKAITASFGSVIERASQGHLNSLTDGRMND